jgi:hypothetical protein
MGHYIHPGYYICDSTGKRLRWVEPQAVELTNKPMRGIGSGNSRKKMRLMLVEKFSKKQG